MKLLSTLGALITLATTAMADDPGLQQLTIDASHHDTLLSAVVWYSQGGANPPTTYADNPVFIGVDAIMDAPVAPGRYPLVLFSHGMGGTDRAQAWLGHALARRGVITVLVNHPGSTWGDFGMARGINHWTRAQDMRAALDTLLDDPKCVAHIDPARIMAAGFSYGGWTALSLGSVRGNHAGLVSACTTHRARMEACDMLLSDPVSLAAIDPETWNADYSDPRITHIAAIDPGFVWGLTTADVAPLKVPTLMIWLGGPATRMMATDFDQSGLAGLMPDAQTLRSTQSIIFRPCHSAKMLVRPFWQVRMMIRSAPIRKGQIAPRYMRRLPG